MHCVDLGESFPTSIYLDYLLRSSAATALGKLGKHAELAVPALIKCLKDRERYVRHHAVTALVERFGIEFFPDFSAK